MKFSTILKQERQNPSMTQSELAEKLYVTNKTISNWETERTLPDLDNLVLLSKELNISLDKLLLEDPNMVDKLKLKMGLRESRVFLLFASSTNLMLFIMLVTKQIHKYNFLGRSLLVVAILCNVVVVLALSIRIQEAEKELHIKYSFRRKNFLMAIAILVMIVMISLIVLTS